MLGNTPEEHALHRYRSRNLTLGVLFVWGIAALIIPFFAESLNSLNFLGFPLGYFMTVQGSLLIFVLLIFLQNWRQEEIDNDYHQDD
ncbi:MAG: sodium/substrate symporter small subunit [Pseudomonadota bacterium]